MSNIAKLPNAQITGEPDQIIIEKLREWVEMAERGEIVGMAAVVVRPNDDVTSWWQSDKGKGHNISTGILIMAHDYARAWLE